jgi:hypothetical protein
MPRPTHNPNTQTAAERKLWQEIRRKLSTQRRRKRKQYGLSSNRAADLYIPHPKHQERISAGKIIQFRL